MSYNYRNERINGTDMELFNQILYYINQVLVTIIGIAFTVQVMYILLFWVKAKRYPEAPVKHKIGVVIPARNESEVIAQTIKQIQASDYPKDKYDIFLVADNCTDNTAEIARSLGVNVYEHFDDDPKHHVAGYGLQYLFEQIMREYPDEYEAFIKFDADNLMEPNYISKMNDAFHAGVKCARGFSNSKNIDQNIVTGISGLWYVRDCRFASHVRSALGTGTILGGAGMMFSAEILKKHGGWDCLSASDDTEFTMRRLNEDKIKTMYVEEAVVYEDQPSTLKETYKRYRRMSPALCKLFFTQGFKSFGLFFRRWGWTYLDLFFTLMFVPVAVLCCIWLPVYYGYDIIYHFCVGNLEYGYKALINIGIILACAFVIPFILQALLSAFLERKRLKVKGVKTLLPAIFAFPLFMIVYAIAIGIGAFKKSKWSSVKRNACNLVITSDNTADSELNNTEQNNSLPLISDADSGVVIEAEQNEKEAAITLVEGEIIEQDDEE